MRTIIIGDIHGCFTEWQLLMNQMEFDEASDRLILLGDLMDRGPDSYKVYREVRRLQEIMQERFVLIRGSHEFFLLLPEWNEKQLRIWNRIGRPQTEASFQSGGEDMFDSVPWFNQYSQHYFIDEKFQCVHAGLRDEDPAENDEYTLLMDHDIVKENQYTGKLLICGHIHLTEPTYFDGHGNIEILPYHESMKLPETGTICLDTGCAEGNKMTGMIMEEDHYILFAQERV